MKQPFFSRGDYVATKVFVVLVALLYPALALVPPLLDWMAGRPLTVAGWTSSPDGPVLDEPTPGTVGRYTDAVVWSVADATWTERFVALLPTVLTTLLVVAGTVVVWRLVSTTQQGRPFDRRAVWQLRLLGILVLGYGLVAAFGAPLVLLGVFWDRAGPSVAFSLDLSALFPFAVGFVVLVVAECFRVGLRLREDVEGLV